MPSGGTSATTTTAGGQNSSTASTIGPIEQMRKRLLRKNMSARLGRVHQLAFEFARGRDFPEPIPNPVALDSEAGRQFYRGLEALEYTSLESLLDQPSHYIVGFHGTGYSRAIPSIFQNNFDPARRNAQVYGPGEYFDIARGQIATAYSRGIDCLIVALIIVKDSSGTPLPEVSTHDYQGSGQQIAVVNNPVDKSYAFNLPCAVASKQEVRVVAQRLATAFTQEFRAIDRREIAGIHLESAVDFGAATATAAANQQARQQPTGSSNRSQNNNTNSAGGANNSRGATTARNSTPSAPRQAAGGGGSSSGPPPAITRPVNSSSNGSCSSTHQSGQAAPPPSGPRPQQQNNSSSRGTPTAPLNTGVATQTLSQPASRTDPESPAARAASALVASTILAPRTVNDFGPPFPSTNPLPHGKRFCWYWKADLTKSDADDSAWTEYPQAEGHLLSGALRNGQHCAPDLNDAYRAVLHPQFGCFQFSRRDPSKRRPVMLKIKDDITAASSGGAPVLSSASALNVPTAAHPTQIQGSALPTAASSSSGGTTNDAVAMRSVFPNSNQPSTGGPNATATTGTSSTTAGGSTSPQKQEPQKEDHDDDKRSSSPFGMSMDRQGSSENQFNKKKRSKRRY